MRYIEIKRYLEAKSDMLFGICCLLVAIIPLIVIELGRLPTALLTPFFLLMAFMGFIRVTVYRIFGDKSIKLLHASGLLSSDSLITKSKLKKLKRFEYERDDMYPVNVLKDLNSLIQDIDTLIQLSDNKEEKSDLIRCQVYYTNLRNEFESFTV